MLKRFILLFLLVLKACVPLNKTPSLTETPSVSIPSITSGFTCGRLCWNGIVIGKTSRDDLIDILGNLPDVNEPIQYFKDRSPRQMFDGRIEVSLYETKLNQKPLVEVDAWFLNNKLVLLNFRGSLKGTVQDMIDKFGKPEKVLVSHDPSDYWNVDLINFSEGVHFVFEAPDEKSEILPDGEVTFLQLYDTKLGQKLFENGWLTSSYFSAKESHLLPWMGYGKLVEKYSPPQDP